MRHTNNGALPSGPKARDSRADSRHRDLCGRCAVSAHTPGPRIEWLPCDPSEWKFPGSFVAWFDLDGCRYFARKDASGTIFQLSKRNRSNARGAYYSRLSISGRAARAALPKVQPE